MADAVEKVRSTEGDMLRASGNLAPNVLENDSASNNAEDAFVDWNDRTMPAKVLAAATGFSGTDNAIACAGDYEMRILFQRRHTHAVRNLKRQPIHGHHRLWLGPRYRVLDRDKSLCQMDERIFEFAAKNGRDSQRAQVVRIHRRIEAVAAKMSAGISFAQTRNELRGQPRGRVHGQVEGDEAGRLDRRFVERLPREIEANDAMAAFTQPGRRRSQPERLAPELVGRNQDDVHAVISITARRLESISVIIEGYRWQRKDGKNASIRGKFLRHARPSQCRRTDLRNPPPGNT